MIVFDRKLSLSKRYRHYNAECGFLFDWAGKELMERRKDMARDFRHIIQIGARGGRLPLAPAPVIFDCAHADIIGDEEALPFAHENLDCVISNLTLHSINDLPGALIQIRRALKPDGLFLAALFGGETLYELRDCMMTAELDRRGGASPHIFPMADKPQMGALMQRAGFALPVVESDILTVTYPNLKKLMHDLRGMGEGNVIAARFKGMTTPRFFDAVQRLYHEKYSEGDRLIASFEIIFLTGWAAADTQQQPMRPGSADHSLKDFL